MFAVVVVVVVVVVVAFLSQAVWAHLVYGNVH